MASLQTSSKARKAAARRVPTRRDPVLPGVGRVEPVPELEPIWPKVAQVALLGVAGVCGVAAVGVLIWMLLPWLAGAALLAGAVALASLGAGADVPSQ